MNYRYIFIYIYILCISISERWIGREYILFALVLQQFLYLTDFIQQG